MPAAALPEVAVVLAFDDFHTHEGNQVAGLQVDTVDEALGHGGNCQCCVSSVFCSANAFFLRARRSFGKNPKGEFVTEA